MRISPYTYSFLSLVVLFFGGVTFAQAEVSVAPILIDKEAEARSIITESITITNNSDQKMNVYATVNEIAVDSTGEIKQFVSPMMTDRTNTITSWVEVTRGRIELQPRTATSVELTLRVHPQAKSGEYHAFIGFVSTNKRPTAEAVALAGEAEGTIVKLSIKEKTSELLRIKGFFIDRFIVNKRSRAIDIEVENNGDVAMVPKGEVIFYNSLGEELTAVPINGENAEVPPGEKRTLKSEVPFNNELGRFKANVSLRYGNGQQAAIFDTAQFFMVPMPVMIGIIIAIFIFSIFVTYLIRRAFYDELHDDDESSEVPLYIRNDREHEEKDHDIHLKKTE